MTAPGDFSSGDVLDAADMNALPAGIAGGNGVGWDTISANQAISTTPVTLLSVTFTAVASSLYQIDFSGYFYFASAALIYRARVNVGGSQINLGDASVSGASEVATISFSTIYAPTAGSKTVEVEALTLSGTGRVAAGASYGPWLIVKDVGSA